MLNRSPSVPETMFTSVLHRLLTHMSLSNTVCMILGDFNYQYLNSAILQDTMPMNRYNTKIAIFH